jgi:hypothetical protein
MGYVFGEGLTLGISGGAGFLLINGVFAMDLLVMPSKGDLANRAVRMSLYPELAIPFSTCPVVAARLSAGPAWVTRSNGETIGGWTWGTAVNTMPFDPYPDYQDQYRDVGLSQTILGPYFRFTKLKDQTRWYEIGPEMRMINAKLTGLCGGN